MTGGTVSATTSAAGGAAAAPPRQAPPVEQAREVASQVNSGAGQGSITATCEAGQAHVECISRKLGHAILQGKGMQHLHKANHT
jgi:hypothetical protein